MRWDNSGRKYGDIICLLFDGSTASPRNNYKILDLTNNVEGINHCRPYHKHWLFLKLQSARVKPKTAWIIRPSLIRASRIIRTIVLYTHHWLPMLNHTGYTAFLAIFFQKCSKYWPSFFDEENKVVLLWRLQ